MKKKIFLVIAIMAVLACIFAISTSAAVSAPVKPNIGVDFGAVTTIGGFTPPSQLFVNTDERVLLTDGNGNYVTYPTYYITKDSTTFDVDFENLNNAQSIQYSKASIVMLEVPNGITTMTNQYFAYLNFENLLSCQIPGSVTNYGSGLFWKNAKTKIVEFLDGTEYVTMGNEMFGGNNHSSYGGDRGTVVEYVKFPNNLTSIGNSTFYKVSNNMTIILGENLTSVGTGFIRVCGWKSNVVSIYTSSNFFGDGTAMTANPFQGFNGEWNGNALRLAIFYTGDEDQAQAFIAKGAAVESGVMYDEGRYQLVSADDYNPTTHTPPQKSGGKWGSMVMVYGVSVCDAFYDDHNLGGVNSCTQDASCSRTGCDYSVESTFTEHNVVKTLAYPNGFDNAGVYNCYCTNATYCQTANPSEYAKDVEKAAIITFKGYSTPENATFKGVSAGFDVNREALILYNDLNETDATLTIFMVNSKSNGVNIEKILEGDTLELAQGVKGVNVQIDATSYSNINISARGFDDSTEEGSYYTFNFIMAMAVKTEDGVHYIQSGLKDTENTTVEIGGIDFNVVTADGVYSSGV